MSTKVIDVAAGVLINTAGEVLLAQRPEGKHMAGFWEFPGGKFEPGENASKALARELEEELGIAIGGSEPLIEICHSYPERTVRLHVRTVRKWQGEISGLDNQALSWVQPAEMGQWDLLPADGPIVNAIKLPQRYAISPVLENVSDALSWLDGLPEHVRVLQWRQPHLKHGQLVDDAVLAEVARWAQANSVSVLVNTVLCEANLCHLEKLGLAGVHLSEKNLHSAKAGTVKSYQQKGLWLAASVHDEAALCVAQNKGVDFVVLGPVLETSSHPGVHPLGWECFAKLVSKANLPVYALGGCAGSELATAVKAGAQGFAGISAFRS